MQIMYNITNLKRQKSWSGEAENLETAEEGTKMCEDRSGEEIKR
jgi:hypothetical protein